jgi:serine/threonine protein kinase
MGKLLGKGSFGSVYEIIEKKTEKKFAFKIIICSSFEEYTAGGLNEVIALNKVLTSNSENIIKTYESYTWSTE